MLTIFERILDTLAVDTLTVHLSSKTYWTSIAKMVRLSLVLLAPALLHMGSSLPTTEASQSLSVGTPAGIASLNDLSEDLPQPRSAGETFLSEKRSLPMTPKWLRWLPFEQINM
ncbi:hypothetical protein F4777DRAFT_575865 [Nemania sp. FL0916]|nr:hypothetical protein F4777DRAFT_575865 [Nemania sp. FL0916]